MKLRRKAPCSDCPFRRNALPGWTGDSPPKEFVVTTLNEHHMPCHLDVDYSVETWLEDIESDDQVSYCVGALQFLANYMKRPRDPELAAAVDAAGTNPEVFRFPAEFVDYHGGTGDECDYDHMLGMPIESLRARGLVASKQDGG